MTKERYGQDLEVRLEDLHARLRSKRYRHPPIRRVHIPKGQDKPRPIGISAFEDKRVQDVVREILEAIYEPDFLDCSYGFRPGRRTHDAVRTLDRIVHRGEVSWILEADIVSFFDRVGRTALVEMLQTRVADGSLLRLIGKCLHVGVLDGAEFTRPEVGTAQGSVLSPLLGNVYLHYVLDRTSFRALSGLQDRLGFRNPTAPTPEDPSRASSPPRPRGACSPAGPCRACCAVIGRGRSRNWRRGGHWDVPASQPTDARLGRGRARIGATQRRGPPRPPLLSERFPRAPMRPVGRTKRFSIRSSRSNSRRFSPGPVTGVVCRPDLFSASSGASSRAGSSLMDSCACTATTAAPIGSCRSPARAEASATLAGAGEWPIRPRT